MSIIIKKISKVVLLMLAIILLLLVVLLAVRAIMQGVNKKQYEITTANGIDAEEIVKIGGIEQRLYIRGEDTSNPVILYLHGGPGSSMIPMIYKYQRTLEGAYTIVNWDQRTAGKTYLLNDRNVIDAYLSMERMVSDVDEVVAYLKDKFQQEKIILLGHSWGSVLGTTYAQKYPQNISVYIGTGQVIEMNSNERAGYDAALAAAKQAGNKKDIDALEQYPDYPLVEGKYDEQAMITQRAMTAKYLAPNLKDNMISTILFSPYCTLKEGFLYLQPLLERQKGLYDYLFYEMKNTPYVSSFEMPVIYIMGEDDWVSPNAPAKAFFDTINAPSKQWIAVEDAGHLSMLDNPKGFCSAVINALAEVS